MKGLSQRVLNQRFLLRMLSIVVVLGLWELAGIRHIVFAFPRFSDTMVALYKLVISGVLPKAFLLSFRSLLIGFAISAVAGIAWGLLMSSFGFLNWLSRPYIIILYGAPTAALVPIMTLTFGIGLGVEAAFVVLMAMPIIILNTYSGVKNVDQRLLEMGRAFLANRRQVFIKILLPDAMPMVMAGLRLGFSLGFVGMILAELMISPIGLGDLMLRYQAQFRFDKLFAVIAAILVGAALLLSLLKRLENRLLRWKLEGSMGNRGEV